MAKKNGLWNEFKAFAIKGNAMNLAVGVIIGGAFSTITTSLTNDMIMPIVSMFLGGINFSDWYITLPQWFGTKTDGGRQRAGEYPELRQFPLHGHQLLHPGICCFHAGEGPGTSSRSWARRPPIRRRKKPLPGSSRPQQGGGPADRDPGPAEGKEVISGEITR